MGPRRCGCNCSASYSCRPVRGASRRGSLGPGRCRGPFLQHHGEHLQGRNLCGSWGPSKSFLCEQVDPVWPAGAYTVLRVGAAEAQGMPRLGQLLHMAALGVSSA